MISAALDPGSARCALVIATDAPTLAMLSARVFEVGHLEDLPAPVTTHSKDGTKSWTRTKRRVHPEEELDALVTAITGAILSAGVESLAVEVSDIYLPDGAKLNALRAQAREVQIADRIAARVIDRCKCAGVSVRSVPRVTWLAALRRHASAGLTVGVEAIPQKVGSGAALDPLIRAHLPALYELPTHRAGDDADEEVDAPAGPVRARMPGADLRDAAGLLLSRVLVCPPPKRVSVTAPRKRDGATRRKRARAVGEDRRKYKAKWKREKIAAAREASGCACGVHRGRHRKGCPLHVSKWARWDEARAAEKAAGTARVSWLR